MKARRSGERRVGGKAKILPSSSSSSSSATAAPALALRLYFIYHLDVPFTGKSTASNTFFFDFFLVSRTSRQTCCVQVCVCAPRLLVFLRR